MLKKFSKTLKIEIKKVLRAAQSTTAFNTYQALKNNFKPINDKNNIMRLKMENALKSANAAERRINFRK
jgi:hypothetical protein